MLHGVLDIARLQVELEARTLPQRAALLERRLLEAVKRLLPHALPAPGDTAAARVFIDELQVQCAVNAAWDDERIVRVLSQAIARGIGQALASEEGRRFADRTEWLAAFLLALAEGHAWRRWWFAEMNGLAPLPTSAALRSVLAAGDTAGPAVLARLDGAALRRVLQALDDADVPRVLAAWAARGAMARPAPMERLWHAALAAGATGARGVLTQAVEIERLHPGAGAVSVRWIAALADLAASRSWRAGAVQRNDEVVVDPAEALLAAWQHAKLPQDLWRTLDVAQAAALHGAIAATAAQAERAAEPAAEAAGCWRTPHGGAFTLLIVIGWLRWPEQWLRDGCDAALVRALCLAVVACALAPEQPGAVLGDEALQRALGLDDAVSLLRQRAAAVAVARLLRRAPVGTAASAPLIGHHTDRRLAGQAAAMLTRLGERVPGCGGAGAAWLRANMLSAPAGIEVRPGAAGSTATCARAPLHVLLLLAGLTRAAVALPGWRVELQTEEP